MTQPWEYDRIRSVLLPLLLAACILPLLAPSSAQVYVSDCTPATCMFNQTWGPCTPYSATATCGTAYRSADTRCLNVSNKVEIAYSSCNTLPNAHTIPNTRECADYSCVQFVTGEWSICSVACMANGNQTRLVYCQDMNYNLNHTLATCAQRLGQAIPPNKQTCYNPTCDSNPYLNGFNIGSDAHMIAQGGYDASYTTTQNVAVGESGMYLRVFKQSPYATVSWSFSPTTSMSYTLVPGDDSVIRLIPPISTFGTDQLFALMTAASGTTQSYTTSITWSTSMNANLKNVTVLAPIAPMMNDPLFSNNNNNWMIQMAEGNNQSHALNENSVWEQQTLINFWVSYLTTNIHLKFATQSSYSSMSMSEINLSNSAETYFSQPYTITVTPQSISPTKTYTINVIRLPFPVQNIVMQCNYFDTQARVIPAPLPFDYTYSYNHPSGHYWNDVTNRTIPLTASLVNYTMNAAFLVTLHPFFLSSVSGAGAPRMQVGETCENAGQNDCAAAVPLSFCGAACFACFSHVFFLLSC